MESKKSNYKQINRDYARAKWPHRKISNNLGSWIVVMIIFMIGFGLMMASAVRADQVRDCSVIGVTTDNLMSEDRAEFMMLFEHGREFDEGDMQ